MTQCGPGGGASDLRERHSFALFAGESAFERPRARMDADDRVIALNRIFQFVARFYLKRFANISRYRRLSLARYGRMDVR